MRRVDHRVRGHIEERSNGSFRAIVFAGVDPVTNKRRYLKRTASTRKLAEVEMTKLQQQVDERRNPRSPITVSQAIEQWLEVTEHQPSTRDRYEQMIRLYITPTIGKSQLARIEAETLERLYARLRKCRHLCERPVRGHTCEPLAPNTVRKVHFILRAAFDRAVKWKNIAVNEAAMAEPPAFAASHPDPPTAVEAAALLNEAARNPDWALFLWLTMTAGWRRGEGCALRWTDVDLVQGVITIERSLYGNTEKSTKTGQGRRIAIDDETCAMLVEHRARADADCAKLEVPLAADAFVFSDAPDRSLPMRPHLVTQRYRRIATKVGLRSHRLHSLRHYSASELIRAGVDVRTVAGRLGHGSGGAVTLKVYAQWSAAADRVAASTIGGLTPRPDRAKAIPRAPYEQVAAALRAEIETGELRRGDELPSLTELAERHDVARNTAHRAITLLKNEGLIEVLRGQRATVVR
jgi:integrase